MAKVMYRQVAELTENEIAAARAYGSESGLFHLACQANHNMALARFQPYQDFMSNGKLVALKSATETKYELASDATLYSGHGNGGGAIGGLGHSEPARFIGLTWRYRGFTSTSSQKEVAEGFVYKGAKSPNDTPVFLELHLPAGFCLLPMEVLGSDSTHEAEFLIPPGILFEVVEARHDTIGGVQNVLCLVLTPRPGRG